MKQKRPFQLLPLFLLIIIGTWSCERDDICAEATATTPHLIIRFYDQSDPTLPKSVNQLIVRGLNEDGEAMEAIFSASTIDSIALPLRVVHEGMSGSVRFEFEKDSDLAVDDDDLTNSDIDVVTINYSADFQYVSRACGYKSIFTDLSINIDPNGTPWILSSELLTTTIDNESQAQIILRH